MILGRLILKDRHLAFAFKLLRHVLIEGFAGEDLATERA